MNHHKKSPESQTSKKHYITENYTHYTHDDSAMIKKGKRCVKSSSIVGYLLNKS